MQKQGAEGRESLQILQIFAHTHTRACAWHAHMGLCMCVHTLTCTRGHAGYLLESSSAKESKNISKGGPYRTGLPLPFSRTPPLEPTTKHTRLTLPACVCGRGSGCA